MSYPQLRIDEKKFRYNVRTLNEYCQSKGVQVHFVTKCLCAYEPLVKIMKEEGIDKMADSRILNLKTLRRYAKSVLLTRIPQISEAEDVVRYTDISLNSELATLRALGAAARNLGKVHTFIVMLEMGDLREGVEPKDLGAFLEEALKIEGLHLGGLGANYLCYGGVIPDAAKMEEMAKLRRWAEETFQQKHDMMSAGNSGNLPLLFEGVLPPECDELRLGESYLLGRETSYGARVLDLFQDVFTLRAEIIESKEKNSLPTGKVGVNAAGEVQHFDDEGRIIRTIVAAGGQDLILSGLTPLDPRVRYLGNSADHTIFNTTAVQASPLAIGTHLDFSLNYVALTAAFTSPYVEKVLVKN